MPQTYRQAMAQLERDYLLGELVANHGNIAATARAIGLSIRTMHFRLKKLGIRVGPKRAEVLSPGVPHE